MGRTGSRLLQLGIVASLVALLIRVLVGRRPQPSAAAPEWPPLDDEPDGAERARQGFVRTASPEGPAWVEPMDDGSCPASHPIKGNADSGIYHPPEGMSYARTRAERCYARPEDAEADGFRRAKR